jgi:hypothetical protein
LILESFKKCLDTAGMHHVIRCAAMSLVMASVCAAGPIDYLATNQTGAQTQVDVAHTSTWLFTPTIDFLFGGGLFDMKDGSNTSANLQLSLFQGSDASGLLLDSVSLTHTTFCNQVPNCNQFDLHQFFVTAPLLLTTGTTYFAQLTSLAPNTQNTAYFIKSTTSFIANQTGVPVNPSPIAGAGATGGGAPTATPEPATFLLIGLGLGACALVERRKRCAVEL